MRHLLAFTILASVKTLSQILYKAEFNWLTEKPEEPFKKAKLMVFLNHTSLYEPLYIQAIPYASLWQMAKTFNVPGADITLDRPIVGIFWKLMIPNIASVTRKQDGTWNKYLNTIRPDSVILLAPEGRMKRPNGLDKYGKPMTVRGGVADIIESLNEGSMILCFSGGLHHVQSPGQHFPRFFKTIKMNFSYHDIKSYKASFPENPRERKIKIVQDLQARLERDCPHMDIE